MAVQLEIILIAAVVAIALIVVGRTIITELAMTRSPYDAGKPTGTPVSPEAQLLPPEG